mmetsp:Transcript_30020/g.78757  ORF Transcript_30020/g.78757 Transcript_30020/m.78757 type:complete len:781 (+) Transcript_30020:131-2473(+)|eukprot:CAMPEP_0182916522 /NCGR_PEP_ID=MMETSP0105_2-20130417/992_1 /TAXON_ID=81532 ORGANISM="Acanthoeca-like sp., Strain 10tr" /NCGR_SAMPLE_ID=MMETSP0105_2 /ASSEMBLY_ACC=CAM_ASM_000205 /LENGTH=780 /DNA_ID=CAMNT_0025053481 /DNA_START=126 /DNA_END=2468 /DNA_ORIENTATION=-
MSSGADGAGAPKFRFGGAGGGDKAGDGDGSGKKGKEDKDRPKFTFSAPPSGFSVGTRSSPSRGSGTARPKLNRKSSSERPSPIGARNSGSSGGSRFNPSASARAGSQSRGRGSGGGGTFTSRQNKIEQLSAIASIGADLSGDLLKENDWNLEKALDVVLGGGGMPVGSTEFLASGGADDLAGGDAAFDDAAARLAAAEAAAEAIATAEVARGSYNDAEDMAEIAAAAADAEAALARVSGISGAMPLLGEMERMLSRNARRSSVQPVVNFVVSFFGNEIAVDLPSDGPVSRLKAFLEERTGIPVAQQLLLGWPNKEPTSNGTVLDTLVKLPTTTPVRLMLCMDETEPASSGPATAAATESPVRRRVPDPFDVPIVAGGGAQGNGAAMGADGASPTGEEGAAAAALPSPHPIEVVSVSDDEDASGDDVIEIDDSDDDDAFDEAFDESAFTRPPPPSMDPLVPADVSDGFKIANYFADNFNTRYKSDGDAVPAFFRAPLSEALMEGERKAKPILVYVHSDTSAETNVFCSEVLARDPVSSFINENYVIWGCDMTLPSLRTKFERASSSQQVLEHISTRRCPALYALVKLPGRIEAMGKIVGFCDKGTAFTELLQFREAAEGPLGTLRAEMLRRSAAERLRHEQQAEFEESLRRDREKQLEKEKKAAEEAVKQAEAAAAEAYDVKRVISAGNKVPPEPHESDKDAMTIQFRMPGNERLKRRFNPTDTIQIVLNFLHSEGKAPAKFDTFHIPRPGQRINLEQEDPTKTLAEFGLHKRDLLYVEEE